MLRKKKTLKKNIKRKKKSLKSKIKKLRGGAFLESITERLGLLGEAIFRGGERHLILIIENMKDLLLYLNYYKQENEKLDNAVKRYREGNEELIWPPELEEEEGDRVMLSLNEFDKKLENFRGELIEHMSTKFEELFTKINKLKEEPDLKTKDEKDEIYEETKKIYTDAKEEIINKTKFVKRISQYLSNHDYEKILVKNGI